jgi:hypothetical protein
MPSTYRAAVAGGIASSSQVSQYHRVPGARCNGLPSIGVMSWVADGVPCVLVVPAGNAGKPKGRGKANGCGCGELPCASRAWASDSVEE